MDVPASSKDERAGCALLIVDDVIEARASLGELLRLRGYTVFEAADADQALTVLNSRLDVSAVITDVQMPGSMDGIALARWLRKTRPSLRVLVLSGYDLVVSEREIAAQLAGEGIACFRKPAVSEALLAALPYAAQGVA